jgi:hypothetical protein
MIMGRNPLPPTRHPGTFKVYELILTQEDDICKKFLGSHQQEEEKKLEHLHTTYEADFRYTTLF